MYERTIGISKWQLPAGKPCIPYLMPSLCGSFASPVPDTRLKTSSVPAPCTRRDEIAANPLAQVCSERGTPLSSNSKLILRVQIREHRMCLPRLRRPIEQAGELHENTNAHII